MPAVKVNGMRCEHCKKSVTEAVAEIPGAAGVEVDLQKGEVRWSDADASAPVSVDSVKKAVNAIGFEAV
ncbi:MAG: cation transporter [Desulfovibrio sp.]|jgi:copper chaperone CopZ|nr:cation transporter [Desulfovibrio sp.]